MIYEFSVETDILSQRMCARKLAREIRDGLALVKRPEITYVGENEPGTDNLMRGAFTVKVPEETSGTLLRDVISAHAPCEPIRSRDRSNYGVDLDELPDFLHASPGEIIFVRDLPRISGSGTGTLVYRVGKGFRRVSDDSRVPVEGDT